MQALPRRVRLEIRAAQGSKADAVDKASAPVEGGWNVISTASSTAHTESAVAGGSIITGGRREEGPYLSAASLLFFSCFDMPS